MSVINDLINIESDSLDFGMTQYRVQRYMASVHQKKMYHL